MKRWFVLAIFMVALSSIAVAQTQQFAKTGLVNLTRIYDKFYKESKGVRDFEALKASIQNDINKFKQELIQLMNQRNDAQARGDEATVQQLDAQIQSKKEAYQQFAAVKQQELKQKSEEVRKDDSFQKLLISEIDQEAVSKGFSLILNLENDSSVVWYSPDADITDGVIARLQVDLAPANQPAPAPVPQATPTPQASATTKQ